jgi:hypothetical protein
MVNKLIEIGGQKRPVNLGRNALIEFEKLCGIKLLSGRKDWFETAESYRALAFAALKWGLYNPAKGNEPNPSFTLFQVGDWLQDRPEAVAELLDFLVESMPQAEKKSEADLNESQNYPLSPGSSSIE